MNRRYRRYRRYRIAVALAAAGIGLAGTAGGAMAAAPRPTSSAPVSRSAAVTGSAVATESVPPSVPESFSGDVQAVAVRIEADEPLPAGSGDIPSVTGEVNSEQGIAKATAAADLLGAVTGPKLADPTGDGHQYANDPQATCSYPPSNTVSQSYPLQGSDQQTAQSQVTCADGPSASGLAYSAQIGGNAGVTNPSELQKLGASSLPLGINGTSEGHESLGPDVSTGTARMAADAEATNFSIPGLLEVAHVRASGWTSVGARPGGASTRADVTISGLSIGGATISLTPKGVVIGSSPAVPIDSAQPQIAAFNQVAATVGCELTLLSKPSTYPQGPLFARPPLPDRVNPDGTDAGSTAAGFVVRCVVPDSINQTNFRPLILQILLGFVGTEARASAQAPQLGTTGGFPSAEPADAQPPSADISAAGSAVTPVVSSPVASPPAETAPSLSNPVVPPGAVGEPAPASPRTAVVAGALVGIRGGLEVGGLGLAALLVLAALALVAPWRVSLAPPGHPEL